MTEPRRRVVRPQPVPNPREQQRREKLRARLLKERAALARWQKRLRRAFRAAEQVDKLRTWASGRCLSASEPGIYTRDGQLPPRSSRRVQRGNSN